MSKQTTPGRPGRAQRRPDDAEDDARPGDDARQSARHAGEALRAVTRLLSAANELNGPEVLGAQLVEDAREFSGVDRALLLSEARRDRGLRVVAASPAIGAPHRVIHVTDLAAIDDLFGERRPHAMLFGAEASELDRALGARDPCESLLLLAMAAGDTVSHVLLLASRDPDGFSEEEKDVASSFAAAAAASFAQLRLTEEQSAQTARQAALARAAKSLNESLDLNRVLVRICQEAASILAADNACVYRGSGSDGLTIDATYGMPPEAVGYRLARGAGLAGKVAELDRPLLTNDYQGMPRKAEETLFGDTHSSLAVPLHWDNQLNGVLAVGYTQPHEVTREQLGLLEAFGELAAAACRNASAHMGLAHAARTDGLTGCLNHAAMHDALRREIERCERTGHRLSLVLVDMDDFKQVNEEHGHLAGDEVLRSVGRALREAVRPYDLVARYGGDEFAIVTIEADEAEAEEVATRALADVSRALNDLQTEAFTGGASAGVAEWAPEEGSTTLIERADRALLFGKQEGQPGTVTTASSLPSSYRPGRFKRDGTRAAREPARTLVPEGMLEGGRRQTDRLRKRTRQLALANALGTRLAAMTDPQAILEAAVEELHRAFGFHVCSVVQVDGDVVRLTAARGNPLTLVADHSGWKQPRGEGVIGRCLRERRPVIVDDVARDSDYVAGPQSENVRSELVVPLWVGETLYGAIDIEEIRARGFDEDDARLVQTVSDQVGSALRSATLYEQLERAYLGTAEALAAALEAKDSYSAAHSRAVVERAEAVGRRLGLVSEDQRNVRFAAIFHDIGKIAVPEAILNKRGPLNEHERREIERHSIVGERILSTVDFLEDVRPLVRHEHERWDGTGYPDRLAGEDIPLGSRIILACDAYDAMTSDRPYRAAMTDGAARSELLAGTGGQFDERVVSALLQELDEAGLQAHPDVSAAR